MRALKAETQRMPGLPPALLKELLNVGKSNHRSGQINGPGQLLLELCMQILPTFDTPMQLLQVHIVPSGFGPATQGLVNPC